MKILALIPARSGSKRLPGKNILQLGCKPLISWTVDLAKESGEFCDVIVSTDDAEIAKICEKSGVEVPWLRPSELATDKANLVDVTLHALNWYESINEKVDGVVLLQPTSPFRTVATLRRGIKLFKDSNFKSVVGVSKSHAHPMWMFRIKGGILVPYIGITESNIQSQNLPLLYALNGCFYLISPENLRNNKSFIEPDSIPLIVESRYESIDVDDEFDFEQAQYLVNDKKMKF